MSSSLLVALAGVEVVGDVMEDLLVHLNIILGGRGAPEGLDRAVVGHGPQRPIRLGEGEGGDGVGGEKLLAVTLEGEAPARRVVTDGENHAYSSCLMPNLMP